jgi:type II secretion system protein G
MGRKRGFTLIELLIVVAIIGIIAAIAIPNLLDAIERSRQKRSLGDIRTMCVAMQSFTVDFSGYPAALHNGNPQITWPLILDINTSPVVVPDLIQSIPPFDGWNVPYGYMAGPDGAIIIPRLNEPVSGHFAIWSLGSDRAPSAHPDGSQPGPAAAAQWCQDPPVPLGTLESHCYETDIVWGDSHFQQSPVGRQKKC